MYFRLSRSAFVRITTSFKDSSTTSNLPGISKWTRLEGSSIERTKHTRLSALYFVPMFHLVWGEQNVPHCLGPTNYSLSWGRIVMILSGGRGRFPCDSNRWNPDRMLALGSTTYFYRSCTMPVKMKCTIAVPVISLVECWMVSMALSLPLGRLELGRHTPWLAHPPITVREG